MKGDLADLVNILRRELLPLLEKSWALLVERYPDRNPSDFVMPIKRFTAESLKKAEAGIPEGEKIYFGICMGRAHQQVIDEFIERKLTETGK